jgi:hypothetical protein
MALGIKTLPAITVGTANVSMGSAECAAVYIQADVGNAAKVIYVGDSTLTGGNSQYAFALSAGQNWTLIAPDPSKPGFACMNLSKMFVAANSAGTVVHVSYLERGG